MITWLDAIHVRTSIILGLLVMLGLCANGCVDRGDHMGRYDPYYDPYYSGGGGYYYSSYDEYYRLEHPYEWRLYQAERARRLDAEHRAAHNAAELRRLQQERLAWERQQQQHRQQKHLEHERNRPEQQPAVSRPEPNPNASGRPDSRPEVMNRPDSRPEGMIRPERRLERMGRPDHGPRSEPREKNDFEPSVDRPSRRR